MKHFITSALIGAAIVTGSGSVLAQRWGRPPVPRDGACFYEDRFFSGQYFCAAVGGTARSVPPDTADRILSVRLIGSAEVIVFRDGGFRGASRRLSTNVADLDRIGWANPISSYRVEPRSTGGGKWGGAYGAGNWGEGGGDGGYGGYGGGAWGGAYGGGSHGGNRHNGGQWTYAQAQEIVRRGYRSTLGRDPDPASESWVTAVMERNWSQAQVEAELRKSDEYLNKPR